MRLAIGAGRPQIVRQLVAEGVLMAIGGAAIGLMLAYAAIGVFQRLEFPTDFPLKLTFALDAARVRWSARPRPWHARCSPAWSRPGWRRAPT